MAEMRAPKVIYELVAREAAKVAGVDSGAVVRFRVDGVAEVVGSWHTPGSQVGSLLPLEGAEGVAIVSRTGHSVRTNDAEPSNGHVTSVTLPGVTVPIRVRHELWGSLLVVVGPEEELPRDVEERLGIFADLAGLAITNADTSAHLLAQATSDPLTGLLNHRAFQQRVETEVQRAKRYDRPLALVLLDLDHFKSINDAYGHQAGDAALMQAATLLEDGARAGDILGRIGGDEFALLLPETNADGACAIAQRCAAEFRAAPVGVASHLTMSAGVCDLDQAKTSKELMQLADGSLYWAKNHGRDNVVVYSPEVVVELSDSDRADRLQRSQSLTSILSLAGSIDAKETPNEEHSKRVAGFVRRLAEAAGWPAIPVAQLAEAARIHDVGKVCIPNEILLKHGALTARVRARQNACHARCTDGKSSPHRRAGPLDRAASRALRRDRLSERFGRRGNLGGCRAARTGRQLGRDDDGPQLLPREVRAGCTRRMRLACRRTVRPERVQGAREHLPDRSLAAQLGCCTMRM